MIRKMVAFAALAMAVVSMVPAQAADASGTIIAPTVVAGGNEGNCVPTAAGCEKTVLARHARCAYLADKTTSQGKVGYVVAVSGGASYTLKPATGAIGDFDITFYESLGTCSGRVAGTGANPAPETRTDPWDATTYGNESGTVPATATVGIITLFGGANAGFVYNES